MQRYSKLLPLNVARCYASAAVQRKKQPPVEKETTAHTSPLITCQRKEFNLLVPEKANSKFRSIPLASKGWLHHKSKGDYFILNATVSGKQLQAEMQDFEDFLRNSDIQFDLKLAENLQTLLNIRQLTWIQQKSIAKIYKNHHTLIAAETGCGKTLAYMLPILQQIIERKQTNGQKQKLNTPLAVIITPGRELATQIGEVADLLSRSTDIKVKTVLGGNTKQLMLNPDFDDVDILVASIGALSKLITTGVYRMEQVRHVVLDEADTLLDDSFTDKLIYILKRFPFHNNYMQDQTIVGTQLILASATMPTNIAEMLQKVIDIETLHQIASPQLHRLLPHIEQKFLKMNKSDRPSQLLRVVKTELTNKRPIIIFSNKSTTSDFASIFLNNNGVNCINLNGDMLMKIRIGRFEQFQSGQCDVLSTTDVGSRGLDTIRARHVINFDFPLHISDYIHRCGRIGRVGCFQKSLVTNFISSRSEIDVVQRIEHAARTGGLLPNVNANIKNLINQRILKDMELTGISPSPMQTDDVFH